MPPVGFRFIFFSSKSGRVFAGTQETLQLIAGTGADDVVLEDGTVNIKDYVDEADMGVLMAGAESAFHKAPGKQFMKPVQVGTAAWLHCCLCTPRLVPYPPCLLCTRGLA